LGCRSAPGSGYELLYPISVGYEKENPVVELHQLEAFEAVALHRSFTRAAEALYLTQPAVTRQVAALEAELKTRLFDRLGRTVRLTAAGAALHRYAEQILHLARDARDAVADIEAGAAGRIDVGASSTLATYVLPSLLRRFRETHPRVEITISTGVSARIVEMVREGEADIGLVTTEATSGGTAADRALTLTVLADYATCVVVPPTHALAKRGRVSASDLAGSSLLLMEAGTNLRTYVDRLLSSAGVAEQVAMELDNVEAIKRMIEADLGISLLPEVSVKAEVAAGRLVALPLTGLRRSHRRISLVHRRDKYLTAALRALMALLRAEI
jgi:DNA-binding transcriptional LysR family regulator